MLLLNVSRSWSSHMGKLICLYCLCRAGKESWLSVPAVRYWDLSEEKHDQSEKRQTVAWIVLQESELITVVQHVVGIFSIPVINIVQAGSLNFSSNPSKCSSPEVIVPIEIMKDIWHDILPSPEKRSSQEHVRHLGSAEFSEAFDFRYMNY